MPKAESCGMWRYLTTFDKYPGSLVTRIFLFPYKKQGTTLIYSMLQSKRASVRTLAEKSEEGGTFFPYTGK